METDLDIPHLLKLVHEIDTIRLGEGAGHQFDESRLVLVVKSRFRSTAAELLNVAIEVSLARAKAGPHGAWAAEGLFTRASLEQSTAPEIALHHASRFAGANKVLEVCTGAGFDAAALAHRVGSVISLEPNPLLAAFARHNLAVRGISNVEVRAVRFEDFQELDARFEGVWADPSRRVRNGERIGDPERYSPPLSKLVAVGGERRTGIKISPGYNMRTLPAGWTREWIGFRDECREQVLWSGNVLADGLVTLVDKNLSWSAEGEGREATVTTAQEGMFLVEPHAALIRSGHLARFFFEHHLSLLDEHIAYGTTHQEPMPSPWYDRFSIERVLPYSLSRLREALHEAGWDSRTQLKKRGFPEEPESLRRRLDLPPPGGQSVHGVVFLTRVGEGHIAMLARRLENEG